MYHGRAYYIMPEGLLISFWVLAEQDDDNPKAQNVRRLTARAEVTNDRAEALAGL